VTFGNRGVRTFEVIVTQLVTAPPITWLLVSGEINLSTNTFGHFSRHTTTSTEEKTVSRGN
jgi:hypothetical protein